jgi:hypothetical protein
MLVVVNSGLRPELLEFIPVGDEGSGTPTPKASNVNRSGRSPDKKTKRESEPWKGSIALFAYHQRS